MDTLLSETNFSTIAALSASVAIKNDNNYSFVNKHVQTDSKFKESQPFSSSLVPADSFTDLQISETIDLQFKDISYFVKKPFSNIKNEIIHEVSGMFPHGQLVCIMGPSGAGKSTLLNALSGYTRKNVSGAIYANGRIRDYNEFKKTSCYITQDDALQMLLTVFENMKIAAEIKLGKKVSTETKLRKIESILTALGLQKHIHTQTKRLSGGQRKRLSLALELINNPTVMFLDEPTTGLDSYSCWKLIDLLKQLAMQGRTIIATIHQPSAKLFEKFDLVYVLAYGKCLYQGHSSKLVPFLQTNDLPCPKYHNPADFVIELASGEYGLDKVKLMSESIDNGECVNWFENPKKILKLEHLRRHKSISYEKKNSYEIGKLYQIKVLLNRGWIKMKRDMTMTHLRIAVNVIIAFMLGGLFINSGNEASRMIDNYNLLFGILIHNMMSTMMLTILTFPTEMSTLKKENFNRWYSISSYYTSETALDFPITLICCILFSTIIYLLSSQPMEINRFAMFFAITLLVILIAQTIGLIVGACFNVVNGTFIGPTLSVPCMMFSGFGVRIIDLPEYMKWGSHVSYLRYGLEGYISALYGDRGVLACERAIYCHYKYPEKFLAEIGLRGDQFWVCFSALLGTYIVLRVSCYYVLRWKVKNNR